MRTDWNENSVRLGTSVDSGKPFYLDAEERRTHTYISGATGKGKSKLIDLIIRRDIKDWTRHRCGMLLLDFHGDIYNGVMGWLASKMPWQLAESLPVVPIDLTRDDYIISYNPLRAVNATRVDGVISDIVQGIAHVWGESNTNATPRFERVATQTLYALHELGGTLADAYPLLDIDNPELRTQIAPKLHGPASGHWKRAIDLPRRQYEEEAESSVNRFKRFHTNARLQAMLGIPGATLDFDVALEEGYILLVNLSAVGGWSGGDGMDANSIATLMLSDLWAAASRRIKDAKAVRPFRVVADEFQRCVTPTIAANLDQARGFGLSMTLASQAVTQLLDKGDIGRAIFRSISINTNNKIVFRQRDQEAMELLTHHLYLNTFDPMRVKFELYGTKVVGQEIVELRSRSTTNTSSDTSVMGTSSSESVEGDEAWRGDSTSDTTSSSVSESESLAETLASVFGKELSSQECMSIEEQRLRAMQKIGSLEKRHALVINDSFNRPVHIRVDDVKGPTVGQEFIKDFAARFIKRLPFALSAHEATKCIEAHRRAIASEHVAALAEPTTAKRRI